MLAGTLATLHKKYPEDWKQERPIKKILFLLGIVIFCVPLIIAVAVCMLFERPKPEQTTTP